MEHISDEDLELYCLGRATNEQLAPIEEHLLECPECVERAEALLEAIDTLRAALWRLERERSRRDQSGGGET
jgi:anti-sigma factor RsiW